MKSIVIALAALSVLAAPVSAMTKIEKVQESINATSDGQWLPKWNQYATAQMNQLQHQPNMSLSTALFLAKMIVGKDFNNGWDEFFWCNGVSAESLSNGSDVKFDYCADTYNWDKELIEKYDPNPDTTLGGLFWTGSTKT